jgi:signal transduction histidine kinase
MATLAAEVSEHAPVLFQQPQARHALARTALRWAGLSLAGCLTLAAFRHAQISQEFDADARARHGALAQRMDQHDAHLTSLAAVAQLDDPGYGSFQAVASAVRKYYPRITAVALVRVDPSPEVLATTDGETGVGADSDAVRQLARLLAAGKAAMLPAGDGARYALVKRLGGEPPTALVLTIDAARLVDPDIRNNLPLWMQLSDANGVVYERTSAPVATGLAGWLPTLRVQQELASVTQPLRLTVQRRLSLGELLPASQVLLVLLASAGLVWLAESLRRVRAARREAHFRAQELRLAHAMRVNGLGEMASGIAHELTQPMTAVLSQSQAGLRLIERGAPMDELVPVLQANVKLAKRAGDILARMRSYASQRPPTTQQVALDDLVAGAVALADADLTSRGIALSAHLAAGDTAVQVDPVSIEQVLHNLLRNAAEALDATGTGRITVSTDADVDGAHISVTDNGPGISALQMEQLFTPFFTTKAGGMGLGLSICERLIDAAGGRIAVTTPPGGGACFTIHLPAERRPT